MSTPTTILGRSPSAREGATHPACYAASGYAVVPYNTGSTFILCLSLPLPPPPNQTPVIRWNQRATHTCTGPAGCILCSVRDLECSVPQHTPLRLDCGLLRNVLAQASLRAKVERLAFGSPKHQRLAFGSPKAAKGSPSARPSRERLAFGSPALRSRYAMSSGHFVSLRIASLRFVSPHPHALQAHPTLSLPHERCRVVVCASAHHTTHPPHHPNPELPCSLVLSMCLNPIQPSLTKSQRL